jgi:hypothetical protein
MTGSIVFQPSSVDSIVCGKRTSCWVRRESSSAIEMRNTRAALEGAHANWLNPNLSPRLRIIRANGWRSGPNFRDRHFSLFRVCNFPSKWFNSAWQAPVLGEANFSMQVEIEYNRQDARNRQAFLSSRRKFPVSDIFDSFLVQFRAYRLNHF